MVTKSLNQPEADPDFWKWGPSSSVPLNLSVFSISNGDYDLNLLHTFPF